MYTVLYVDDEPGLLEIGKLFLEEDGQFIVDTISSATDALALLDTKVYDAIISDYHMPVMDGVEFLKKVRTSGNTIPFILFTGRGREEIVIQALNEGADFYLQKGGEPVSQFTELSHQIVHAVKRKRAEKELAISVEKYRRIVDTTDEGIWQMDEKFETDFVNPKITEMLGYTPEEMIGRNIASFMTAEDIPDNISQIEERRLGKSGRYERRFITKDGRIRWMQVSATPLIDPDGTFRGSFVMCSDITARKTAEEEISRRNEDLHAAYEQLTATEEELRQNYDELAKNQGMIKESERKYRNVVEDQTEFISRFLPDGTHVFVNEAYCRYFNLKSDEIIGHRFRPKIPREDRDLLEHYFASLTPDHPSNTIENRIIMPDGSLRWQWWSNRAIFDDSGKVTEYQAVGRDITEEKTTEIALQESEQRLSSIYNAVGDVIFQLTVEPNEQYRFTSVNPAFGRVTGLPTEQVIGRKVNEIIPEPSLTMVLEKYRQAIKEKTIVHWEEISDYPTRQLTGDVSIVPIFDKKGICTHLIGSVHDITERKQAESELRGAYEQITASEEELRSQYNKLVQSEQQIRESEEKYRKIIENAPYGMHFYELNPEKGLVFTGANPSADSILGVRHDQFIGKTIEDVFPGLAGTEVPARYREVAESGSVWHTEQVLYNHGSISGAYAVTAFQTAPGYVAAMFMDITERKRAEDALREANKKLNLLSGITRHDINNQLLTARGFLKVLQKKIPDPAYEKDFTRIEETWGRIFSMIQFTRQYEQIGVSAPVWQDCRILVDTAVNDISPGNILVKNDLPANAEVFADPLVVKVFYNLVDNAIRHGVKISQIHFFLQESADGCCVICDDDGAGVPAEEKERIFDRGSGKNTGMGLYLAREILAITGITIRETGTPGKGAKFEITVPRAAYRFADMQKNPEKS